jgi:hypothetical protein
MVEDLNLKIDHFNSVIVRFENIAIKLEKVERKEKIEKSEQKNLYASIVRKNKRFKKCLKRRSSDCLQGQRVNLKI